MPTPPFPSVLSIVKIRYVPSSVVTFVVFTCPLSVITTCIGSAVRYACATHPAQVRPITNPNVNPISS